MARKVDPETAHPKERVCKHCGTTVYKVTAYDGGDVEIDTSPIATTYERDRNRCRVIVRVHARHPVVKTVGGHHLLKPELFYGWECEGAQWQFFSKRMTLEEAAASGVEIYSEHIATCAGRSEKALLAKFSNVAVIGSAANTALGNRGKRRINLEVHAERSKTRKSAVKSKREAQPVLYGKAWVKRDLLISLRERRSRREQARVLAESMAASPHHPATVPIRQSDGQGQLTLF